MVGRGRANPSVVYWLDNTLYLNITNRCTCNCYFCIRKFKTGIAEFNLKLEREPTTAYIVRELQKVMNKRQWREIVFCGFGEPTVRLDTLLEVAKWIDRNIQKPIRLDTNGLALALYPERNVVKELKEAGLNKVSVSLNAHDEATYDEVCLPRFANAFRKVLEFMTRVQEAGLEVEATAVAIPEVEISRVEDMARDMRVRFRVRPYRTCVW